MKIYLNKRTSQFTFEIHAWNFHVFFERVVVCLLLLLLDGVAYNSIPYTLHSYTQLKLIRPALLSKLSHLRVHNALPTWNMRISIAVVWTKYHLEKETKRNGRRIGFLGTFRMHAYDLNKKKNFEEEKKPKNYWSSKNDLLL